MSWLSSSWRNPFLSLSDSQRKTLAAQFRAWSEAQPWLIDAAKRELGCAELDSASLETCHGEVIRDWLLDPARRWIMVFGSNEAGRHGKGAALVAHHRFEAAMGVGQGLTGNAWALPTKDATLKTLPLGRIQEEAQELLHYARLAPNFHFMLSRVGCGLARYTDEQIAPFFADAPENIHLPGRWQQLLRPESLPRVVVYGSRGVADPVLPSLLDRLGEKLGKYVLVSGGTGGADTLGEGYAVRQELPFVRFPALRKTQGESASRTQVSTLLWYGTHVLALWDGEDRGTLGAIRAAQREGTPVWVPRLPI